MNANSIIVFDEGYYNLKNKIIKKAHNIDDVCIEAMTIRINKYILDGSV